MKKLQKSAFRRKQKAEAVMNAASAFHYVYFRSKLCLINCIAYIIAQDHDACDA